VLHYDIIVCVYGICFVDSALREDALFIFEYEDDNGEVSRLSINKVFVIFM